MEIEFKQYTGTKTIKAMIMSAEEAKRHGAQITDETVKKNIGNMGYLVEYPDGYRSWSPKKAFEDAYRVSETHVDRMKIELADLKERICKATSAINTFGAIPEDGRWLLNKQLEAMQNYAAILYDRIRFAVEAPTTIKPLADCCKAATSKEDK